MTCPLCRESAESQQLVSDLHSFSCKTCGSFKLTGSELAIVTTARLSDRVQAGLSAYVRQANRCGETPFLWIQNRDWKTLAEAQLASTVATKLRKLLEHVSEKGGRLGAKVEIDSAHDSAAATSAPAPVTATTRTAAAWNETGTAARADVGISS